MLHHELERYSILIVDLETELLVESDVDELKRWHVASVRVPPRPLLLSVPVGIELDAASRIKHQSIFYYRCFIGRTLFYSTKKREKNLT